MLKKLSLPIATALIGVSSFGSMAATVFTEDFQSGQDGWAIGGSGDSGVVSKAGSLTLNLAKTATATVTIDTSGLSDINISMDMIASSLESADWCVAEAKGAGGSWITIGDLHNGEDNSAIYPQSGSHYTFDDTTLTLRLRAVGNINSDDCFFDNIVVQELAGGPVRTDASYNYLMGSSDSTFPTSAFVQGAPGVPSKTFEGNLTISGTPTFSKNYGVTGDLPSGYQNWPGFNYEFVQDGNRLIPVDRGHGFVGNGAWSISAGVGAVWDEAGDNGYSRAAFPYTVKENNAN
jgi:hypothetical protein